MFNASLPRVEDLPTSGQLLRSTAISAGIAGALLVTVLLPAEYAVDPTRVGRLLGLTQMGEIKRQLAEESAAEPARGTSLAAIEQRIMAMDAQLRRLETFLSSPQGAPPSPRAESRPALDAPLAPATPATPPSPPATAATPPAAAAPSRVDDTVVTLKPEQGIEIKLRMRRGAEARFSWRVDAGHVNFDTHGEPPNAPRGFYHGYGTGRSATADQGRIIAAFDGTHGWFFRNRSGRPVSVTLRTEGDYETIIRPNG